MYQKATGPDQSHIESSQCCKQIKQEILFTRCEIARRKNVEEMTESFRWTTFIDKNFEMTYLFSTKALNEWNSAYVMLYLCEVYLFLDLWMDKHEKGLLDFLSNCQFK